MEAHDLLYLGAALVLAGLFVKAGAGLRLPSIPFLIVAGFLIGPHSPGPVFIHEPDRIVLLATLGLIFLLFHLGLEFSLDDLTAGGRNLARAGTAYIGLNTGIGLAFGLLLGWGWQEAFVIAGMLGTSSTAIVTKLLVELGRLGNRETGMILGIVVVEDVFLAFYLALLQPVLLGASGAFEIVVSVVVAFGVLVGLFALARWGHRAVGAIIGTRQDELLTIMFVGFAVLVAGVAEAAGASDAIGALMAGMVLAGTAHAKRIELLVAPLRNTFSAIFFIWFGTTIDPSSLTDVVVPVTLAIIVSIVFNVVAGIWAARIYGYGRDAAANAASLLVSRGEFELILASLAIAAGLDERVAPFAALYVFALSLLSPVLATYSTSLAKVMPERLFAPRRRGAG